MVHVAQPQQVAEQQVAAPALETTPSISQRAIELRAAGQLDRLDDVLVRDAEVSLQNTPADHIVESITALAPSSSTAKDMAQNIERHRHDLVLALQSILGADKVDPNATLEDLVQLALGVENNQDGTPEQRAKLGQAKDQLGQDLQQARELILKEIKPGLIELAELIKKLGGRLPAQMYADEGSSPRQPLDSGRMGAPQSAQQLVTWLLDGQDKPEYLHRIGERGNRLEEEAKAMHEVGKALEEQEKKKQAAECKLIEEDLAKIRELVLRLKFIDPVLARSSVGLALAQEHFIDERYLQPESQILATRPHIAA